MKRMILLGIVVWLAGHVHASSLAEFKTADELWKHIEKLQAGPTGKPQTQEELVQIVREFRDVVAEATEEFEKRHPTDARRWEAQLFRLEVVRFLAEVTDATPDHAAALQTLTAIINAADVGAFPKRRARQLSRQVERELAEATALAELKSKPLDLKFTAVDGAAVDLAKLRGKVVLVDFWATWCGPCVKEAPQVVATYKKYREQGFEIVGISLDQDKERLLAFAKKAEMTWPQYYDGKVWENDISSRYNIRSIPAMWLVDKKGYLRDANARGGELTAAVEKLLAE